MAVNPYDLSRLECNMEDRRYFITLKVMLGIPSNMSMDVDPQDTKPTPPPSKNEKLPKPMQEDLPENRILALKEKELGNNSYKDKEFDKAVRHYQKAIEHDSTDITFYTNMAAVYFEQKEYEKCIKECEKAIEIGRENRADFKLISKAFTRIGKYLYLFICFYIDGINKSTVAVLYSRADLTLNT